jgi:pyruvate,orthophosphate dikinase
MIDLVLDAQGEDVVSGRRTPDTEATLAAALPTLKAELAAVLQQLEQAFCDVQDVEFTVENGRLWILQTRSAKRTPRAALRIALDLVHEGLISRQEALVRLADIDLASLSVVSLQSPDTPIAVGVGASGAIAAGRVAFDVEAARRLATAGDPVILVRPDTSTADIPGFAIATGIVTAVGARTSHAALVARQMDKACVVGCSELTIDAAAGRATLGGKPIATGDWITIDGETGKVFFGRLATAASRPETELAEIASWRAGVKEPMPEELPGASQLAS